MKPVYFAAFLFLFLFITQTFAADVGCGGCAKVGSCSTQVPPCGTKCEYNIVAKQHNICTSLYTSGNCQTGSRCSDGTCCNIDIEEVKIGFTDEYVRKTIAERKFDPRQWGLTPFDDFACNVKILVCEADDCVKKAKEMPKTGRLTTSTASEDEVVLLELNNLDIEYLGSVDASGKGPECKYLLYRWLIKNWSKDIMSVLTFTSDNTKVNKLVEAGNISCTVALDSPPKQEFTSHPEKVEPCVNLWGKIDADFRLASLRDESYPYITKRLVEDSISVYENGFQAIEPFKSNKDKFSHMVDLKVHPTARVNVDSPEALRKALKKTITRDYDLGCKGASYNFLLSDYWTSTGENEQKIAGWTWPGYNVIAMIPQNPPIIAVHEFFHAFAYLNDETVTPEIKTIAGTNCKVRKGNSLFPDNGFIPFGNHYLGCTLAAASRSSDRSVMYSDPVARTIGDKPNVVSCGYTINRIRQGKTAAELRKAMNDCCKLAAVIKPTGTCGDA